MELPSCFADFLTEIRPTDSQANDCASGHQTLRARLEKDEDLKDIFAGTFLQGSYRRATAVRPEPGENLDVDIIVVTKLDYDALTPDQAITRFVPFVEKHYAGKYRRQGRSIGIELSDVDLDLVVTALPKDVTLGKSLIKAMSSDETLESLADTSDLSGFLKTAAKDMSCISEPLWIPDRDAKEWRRTHPIAQIEWTWAKNNRCNDHYVNVVKAIKWWRRTNHPSPKHPKSYPLEHIVGCCCPDGITSVAQGIADSLAGIRDAFAANAEDGTVPNLADRGVPEHDVLGRITPAEFAQFYEQASSAADLAKQALEAGNLADSVELWRKLLGKEFPPPPEDKGIGQVPPPAGFTPRDNNTTIGKTRFA